MTERMKVAQLCLTLCDPTDYTVHGILQARILEWIAVPSLGDLPHPGIESRSSPMQETWVRSLGWGDPLEKGKATHSSILAWRIPWTVQSMGLQRVRHN